MHRAQRQISQAGVHDGRILALQQANAPDFAGERHARTGDLIAHNFGGAHLEFGIHGREDGADGNGRDAQITDLGGDSADFLFIKWRYDAPIEFVAAMRQEIMVSDNLAQVIRPIDPWAEGRPSPVSPCGCMLFPAGSGARQRRW